MLNYTGTEKEGRDRLSHLVAQNRILRIRHRLAFQGPCDFHAMVLPW